MATDVARLALQIDVTGARRAQNAMESLRSGSVVLTRATEEQIAAQYRLQSSYQGLANTGRRTVGMFKLQRGAIQQAGYQIGDFAVQVGAGQSALVAFSQQGSQLAGILGPGGALIGAVIAIGAAIANPFFRAMSAGGDSVEDLTDKTMELVEALGEATRRQREFIDTQFAQRISEQARAVGEAEQTIFNINRRMESFTRNMSDQERAFFEGSSVAKGWREELDAARLTIDNAESSIQSITKEQDEFWEGVRDGGDDAEETTDKLKEMVASLQAQADTVALSARETALYEANRLGANAADREAINNAFDQIEAEKLRQDQIKETQAQEKALASLRAQSDPAFAEFNRYADQVEQIEQFNITAAEKDRLREAAFQRHQNNMAEIAREGTGAVTEVSEEGTNQLLQQQQQLNAQVVSTFGNVLGAIRGFTEQGTAEWVAMTIAQKGIMAGQAIMAANLAAAQTLSASIIPGDPTSPLRAVALAETIRNLGYVNAGLIVAQGVGEVAQSFDGGGFTGTGARSGGLDGKGGFMAMMHPNETVIDHTKGQEVGGGVVINIHNAQPGTRTEERTDSQGRQMIDVFIADVATGGPMSKTMQSTYGLRRQGR